MAKSGRLLSPVVRAGEILFGLIMTLTLTCSVSLGNVGIGAAKQMLFAAIGCNMAWGLVDAIAYLLSLVVKRNRNKLIFDAVRRSPSGEAAQEHISEVFPPLVSSILTIDDIEKIRKGVSALPADTGVVRITRQDLLRAMAIFFLVFGSTFPVVIPFLLISGTITALRVSNGVAILMMFFCGWSVASYAGLNRWLMSVTIVLIGLLLVGVTIVLGG